MALLLATKVFIDFSVLPLICMQVVMPLFAVQVSLAGLRLQYMLFWCAMYCDALTIVFLFLVRDFGSWKVRRMYIPRRIYGYLSLVHNWLMWVPYFLSGYRTKYRPFRDRQLHQRGHCPTAADSSCSSAVNIVVVVYTQG